MKYVLLLSVVMACGNNGAAVVVDAPVGVVEGTLAAQVATTPNQKLDVLLLVDDSASTIENQVDLGGGMAAFLTTLGAVDLHVGVATSDMGTSNAAGEPAPDVGDGGRGSCSGRGKNGMLTHGFATNVSDPFLRDDGAGQRNYTTDDLPTTLANMVLVGADGCGFEQHLAGMAAALDGRNAGFLRDDANLLVLIEGDEDDCSAHDPSLFSSDTAALGPLGSFRCTRFGVTCADGGATPDDMTVPGPKGRCTAAPGFVAVEAPDVYRRMALGRYGANVMVGAIVGPPTPFGIELDAPPMSTMKVPTLTHSCQFQGADGPAVADPAVRLTGFADLSWSVCDADQRDSLAHLGEMGASLAGSASCVLRAIGDVETCVAEDIVGGLVVARPPRCDVDATGTCWELAPDPGHCNLDDHLALRVRRAAGGPADPATVTRLRCL